MVDEVRLPRILALGREVGLLVQPAKRPQQRLVLPAPDVVASPVPGESNTANNSTSLDVAVEHVLFGDLNADGKVNVLDMLRQRNLMGEDAALHPEADLNGDGLLNVLDLIRLRNELSQ